MAYQVGSGIDPRRILLLTFTRRAAREMLRRVDAMLRSIDTNSRRRPMVGQFWGGTFHSVATRLLRQHGRLIGLEPDFTILDRSDSEDLMNLLRRELNLDDNVTRFPLKSTCLDIYSRCVIAHFLPPFRISNTSRNASQNSSTEVWYPDAPVNK